jgi:rhodanese-related sulfurtransferase
MRHTWQRALLIVVAGTALGLVANAISPKRIPFVTPPKPVPQAGDTLSLETAQAEWNTGATFFLDARAPADFEAGRIANAFNLPADSFETHFPQVAGMLTPDTPIVVYCDGEECELSHRLKDRLRQAGFKNVRVLVNGWTVWRGAGLPVETGPRP